MFLLKNFLVMLLWLQVKQARERREERIATKKQEVLQNYQKEDEAAAAKK